MAVGADTEGRTVHLNKPYKTDKWNPKSPDIDMSTFREGDYGELEPGGYPVSLDNGTNSGWFPHQNIIGDARDNVIIGGRGNDNIQGMGGDDVLYGDNKSAKALGIDGQDMIWGGDGDDRIYGGGDKDTLRGGTGNDDIWGGDGDDELNGGAGIDEMWGGTGDDKILGDEGNDELRGGEGLDYLLGGQDDDRLYGGEGDDRLFGGAGKDTFYFAEGGAQTDRIEDFSAGEDFLVLDHSMKGNVTVYYDAGAGLTVLEIRMNGNGGGAEAGVGEYRGIWISDVNLEGVNWNEDSEYHKFDSVIA